MGIDSRGKLCLFTLILFFDPSLNLNQKNSDWEGII
jgi:hypothetical protein